MADILAMRAPGRPRRDAASEADPAPAAGRVNELTTASAPHKLDSEDARAEHRKLMQWYYYERDRQAPNRLEMAMDHDFYDGDQWDANDKEIVESRGQQALTYNEVAPMSDWIIGTERRNRVDWKVLPRAEDDVQLADIKTKCLKYVSDVNRVPFQRSRAFADAVKGGEGFVDDGVRDDPTQDIIYSRYEDWRCVLMDSSGLDLTGEDARYVFRWRWVDEDVALMMFPDRADVIRTAVEDWATYTDDDEEGLSWSTPMDSDASRRGGTISPLAPSSGVIDGQRRRVKLIECQYRKPVSTKVVSEGPFRGAVFDARDKILSAHVANAGSTIVDRVMMRVHVAVMTEASLLGMGAAAYRHNKLGLTRMVCYRRGRDRMPYGVIRRVRSIQQDLNKRASKALWLLNTNQIIGDRDAVDDWDEAAEEAQMPDGRIKLKPGANFDIRRDTDAATGQLQLMTMAAGAIQKSAGVTDENLGRKTNAISGEAIKARQQQGAVVTTEPFDNLRLGVQCQGEKQLSLIEQFYTQEKVLRLTGAQGALEWVKVNQPEVQADGTVRYLNDVTSSIADFVVSEADYAGTLRQVMFDSMNNIAQKLPPEIAMRFLRIAFEFSDLPNKSEIVDEIRKLVGERDPNKQMTPEEAQAAEQQMAQQQEAMQMQREQAKLLLEEQQAKVAEVRARAQKLEAESQALVNGGGGDAGLAMQMEVEKAVRQVQERASQQIEALSQQLAKAQASTTNEVMKINKEADTAAVVARIKADAEIQRAEIQRTSDAAIEALMRRLDGMAGDVQDLAKQLGESQSVVKKLETKAAEPPPPAPAPAPAAAPAAAPATAAPAQPPVTVVVQPQQAAAATVAFQYDAEGKLKGGVFTREDGTEVKVDVEGAKKDPKK